MLNSVKKCQLLLLQDLLYYEMNLSILGHKSDNQRSVSNYNINRNINDKANDKQVYLANTRVFENQHNELMTKSINEAKEENNIIRVQLTSLRIEDVINKNLNDSRLMKSINQKIEKLDIQVKEKHDLNLKAKISNKLAKDDYIRNIECDDKIFCELKEKLSEKKVEVNNYENVIPKESKAHKTKSLKESSQTIGKIESVFNESSSYKKIESISHNLLQKSDQDRKSRITSIRQVNKVDTDQTKIKELSRENDIIDEEI